MSVYNNNLNRKGRKTFEISQAEFHLNIFLCITLNENILSNKKCFLS